MANMFLHCTPVLCVLLALRFEVVVGYVQPGEDLSSPLCSDNGVVNALQAVFTAGAEGYHCYRIPALLYWNKTKTLYAFAEGRKLTCADHDWNDIVMKTSTDYGVTWSQLSVVYSNNSTDKHVTIGRLKLRAARCIC